MSVRASESVGLVWEDDASATPSWWLSRANQDGRQFFIAPDPATARLLGVVRTETAPYQVIAVGAADATQAVALADLKSRIAALAAAVKLAPGPEVARWKRQRFFVAIAEHVPLTISALVIGAAIGGAAGMFAVSADLIGWPLLVVGIALGAAAGPLLKFLVERWKPGTSGPWARLIIATLAAAVGAIAVLGTILMTFWN